MILESLYRPSQKDRLAGLAPRRYTEIIVAAAAATIVAAPGQTCPPDVVRMVRNISFRGGSGAAQYLRAVTVYGMVDGNGVEIAAMQPIAWEGAGGPTGAAFSLQSVNPEFMLMPGEYLNGTSVWSAGAAVNQAIWYVSGWEIPRGNIQR